MQLHELLGQRQPESRALLRAGVVAPDLAELLEDGRLVLGRDPDPRVADRDGDGAIGRRGGEAHSAALGGELHRVGEEVQQDLLDLPLVGDDIVEPLVYGLGERDPVSGRSLPDEGEGVVEGGRQMEPPELQLEPTGLHFGEVEDVVDQGEEMPARGQDVLEVLGLLLVHLPEHPLRQHLREAEDRVQRRAQLVGHVGQELGLVAAGRLELPALVRDLAEEPGVLDGQSGLGGEGLEEIDHLRRELSRLACRDTVSAPRIRSSSRQRDAQDGSIAEPRSGSTRTRLKLVLPVLEDVGELDGIRAECRLPGRALSLSWIGDRPQRVH